MEDRVAELERQVSELSQRLERLEARAEGLPAAEGLPTAPGPVSDSSKRPPTAEVELPALPDLGALLPSVSLFGRSLVVIGGAFLIRAITDKGLVHPDVGVGLGIAFAMVWVGLAWREAGLGRALSATFLGVTACLVGFPLILESATRLALVSTNTASVVLGCFTTALLAVAGHRRLRLVAWVGALGGTVTAGLLLRETTGSPFGPSAALVVLFAVTLALADARGWTGPRWVTALVTDGVVIRGVFSAAALPETTARLGPALVLSALTALFTLAFIARRTLEGPSREPTPAGGVAWSGSSLLGAFEVVQAGLAIALGLGGAARASSLLPWVPVVAGALALLFAFGALLTCVRLSERDEAGFEVWFHGAAGLALLLGGGPLLTRGPLLSFTWAALALVATVLARHSHTGTLWTVGAALAWAAAISGGLAGLVRDGLWAESDAVWGPFSFERGLVLALVAVAYLSMSVRPPRASAVARALPATLLGLVLLATTAALSYLARAVGGPLASDAGWLALFRTLVMVGGAVGLGALRRLVGGPVELAWIAWAALGAAGLKMLGQDLQAGRPSTLFIAFLALGSGILALPRLLRTGPPTPPVGP